MAVYAYFAMTLIGSQVLISTEANPRTDIYFPLFVVFKLILLVGWLKVANCIEKPFGTDDTDFQAWQTFSTITHFHTGDRGCANFEM